MSKFLKILLVIFMPAMLSCSKEDMADLPTMPLQNKTITNIRIIDEDIWYTSTRICDTCYVPAYSSSVPMITQLSRQRGSEFRFDESRNFTIPVVDNKGTLYTSTGTEILRINDIRDYTSIVKTGKFTFYQFVFDRNNRIWMSGNGGVGLWDGSSLKIYNSSNSDLPSDITHGIAVDHAGTIWIALDLGKGILKITDGKWEIIPYEKIPGLDAGSYLSKPLVDKNNRVWFTSFNSTNPTNVICFDGRNWITEFPGILKNGELFVDSQGVIWRLNHIINTSNMMKFTLQFLNNDTWENYDVSDVNHLIISLDANSQNVFLGTNTGLVVKRR